MYAHHKHNNVNWIIVKRLVLGLVIGGVVGAYLATMLTSQLLKQIFATYMLFVVIGMWRPITHSFGERLLSKPILFGVANFVGCISALVGIGGGSLLVPYLLMAKQSMQRGIGTSAACGFPISVAAAISFLVIGNIQGVSADWQTGFIHWQAFLGIISTSAIFAMLGAKLANNLPVKVLKKLFSLALLGGAIYLILN
jgi:uncharacterized membrane protein YfcA